MAKPNQQDVIDAILRELANEGRLETSYAGPLAEFGSALPIDIITVTKEVIRTPGATLPADEDLTVAGYPVRVRYMWRQEA